MNPKERESIAKKHLDESIANDIYIQNKFKVKNPYFVIIKL